MQDHRPCSILALPAELQLRIFRNLSFKDILRCAQTCCAFQNIISASMELQYQIKSAAHCLRLLRVDDQPIHERYQLLQEKIRSLSSLDFRKVGVKALGTYNGLPDNVPRVSFVDGWLGVAYPSRRSCAARLINCNATTPSQPPRAWARNTLNRMPRRSFSLKHTILDVRQDLLVFASVRTKSAERDQPLCRLELRTISGAQEDPHPLAAQGTLVSQSLCNNQAGNACAESKLEVNGDFVAMLVSDCGLGIGFFSLLQVWNWKEGGTTFTFRTYHQEVSIWDFCFLDSERLLVFTASGHIEVYSYADFDKPLHLQARFVLVGRMPKCTYLYTSPFSDSVYTTGGTLGGPTFVPSVECRISVLAITKPGRLLVIWNDIFLPHVPPFPDIQKDEHGVYIVPWNVWGPRNTRALAVCGSHSILLSVSGSRLLLGRPREEHSGAPTGVRYDLFTWDFNPARVSSPLASNSFSTIARPLFPGTTLPYRETELTSLSSGLLVGVHMNENGLVLVRPRLSDDHQPPWQVQLEAELFRTRDSEEYHRGN